jgi:hypothetical protein
VKNTITKDHIEQIKNKSKFRIMESFDKVTIVSMRLPNGFVITESSACVDPLNYSKEIGVSICKKRIEDKLWELEGYRLQCSLKGGE